VVENATGTACEQDIDYYPYGGQENDNCPNVAQHYKFTDKERDTESGLDNFGARYYGSNMGRFIETDPIWVKGDRILDPQRLNLYAYGRNNPLKFTDLSGMDVRLGNCPSDMTTSMCEAAVLDGLSKQDRGHVHFTEGDGKNGAKKGETLISVDKDYKSNSGNFSELQHLANDHSATAVVNVNKAGETFASNVAVQKGSKVVLQPFSAIFGVDNYVSRKDNVPGQTLFQLWGDPVADTIYSNAETQVYASSDETGAELSATIYHELTHVFLGDFGRSVTKGREDDPGVKPKLDRAEEEAKENYKDK